MRIHRPNVKQLARTVSLCHEGIMKSDKPNSKEGRLAEALRANLRRRKAPNKASKNDNIGADLPQDVSASIEKE